MEQSEKLLISLCANLIAAVRINVASKITGLREGSNKLPITYSRIDWLVYRL